MFLLHHPLRSIGASLVGAATLLAAACSSGTMPTSPETSSSATASTPAPAPVPTPTPPPSPPAAATTRYRVTFEANWSAATHPVDFPAQAHFSPLIGGTHNSSVTFWREGALASDGIRDMAERGLTVRLTEEVAAAIAAGTAERVVTGGGISSGSGTVSTEFEMSQSYPFITLVTMIAPSPDWFVGVSRLALFENGQWVEERRIDLVPWDAGTDSGVTFTSPDLPTAPPQPVAQIVTAPLSPGGRVTPLGTFTFTRIGT